MGASATLPLRSPPRPEDRGLRCRVLPAAMAHAAAARGILQAVWSGAEHAGAPAGSLALGHRAGQQFSAVGAGPLPLAPHPAPPHRLQSLGQHHLCAPPVRPPAQTP